MALSEEDKKETRALMAEAFADGIALFRSRAEEEAAKVKAGEGTDGDKNKGGNTGDAKPSDGFSLTGFLLGG